MGLTIEQARAGIGRAVVYRSSAQREGRDKRPADDGVIRRVTDEYVHVAYRTGVMATSPEDLEFLAPPPALDDLDHQERMTDAREALATLQEHS